MPELPEVETTCRGIKPYIQGKAIEAVVVRNARLRWPVPDNLNAILANQTCIDVTRRGKYLLLKTSSGTLLIHLGMSGSLRFLTKIQDPKKHDHIDFIFSDNSLLRFNDPRRFGAVLWSTEPIAEHALLKHLGPEPLLEEFTGKYLYEIAQKRIIPIKSFIMDSRNVVGVGNIYANEALFMAGIRPTRPAGKISLKRYETLAANIRQVLTDAITQGGTTLRDFVNESGKPGYFKQQLKVYGRGHQPCTLCTQPLIEIRMNNRTTVFCSGCQK
jgi:formamidopyrimidine-DNA glycosylase